MWKAEKKKKLPKVKEAEEEEEEEEPEEEEAEEEVEEEAEKKPSKSMPIKLTIAEILDIAEGNLQRALGALQLLRQQ